MQDMFIKISKTEKQWLDISVVTESRLELEPDSSTVVLKNLQTRSNSLEALLKQTRENSNSKCTYSTRLVYIFEQNYWIFFG